MERILDELAMIPQSLRALLEGVIDYAGLYPPASLSLDDVIANYQRYLRSPDAWMLNRLVLPFEKLPAVVLEENWRITLLVADEPGPLPRQVETLESKSGGRLSLPTYCEAPVDQIEEGFAKIRTTDPSSEALAAFLRDAATRRLPFKATAGLHHPVRTTDMHGFLNLFVAATLAWRGVNEPCLTTAVSDTDPRAFEFRDDELRWRDHRVSTAELTEVRRNFAHSFGSCSFEEPVNELRQLGFLPWN